MIVTDHLQPHVSISSNRITVYFTGGTSNVAERDAEGGGAWVFNGQVSVADGVAIDNNQATAGTRMKRSRV